MTPESVTIDKLSDLAAKLISASAEIHRLTMASIDADITPKYASDQVNRIIAELNELAK